MKKSASVSFEAFSISFPCEKRENSMLYGYNSSSVIDYNFIILAA